VPTHIGFLRAVNIGRRQYKTADLRAALEKAGYGNVETYIQTGNVRFRALMRSPAKVEEHVERVLGEHCGFDVPAVIFTPAELSQVYADAKSLPDPGFGVSDTQRRYVTFFKVGHAPTGEVARRIEEWDEPGEYAVVIGRAVHIWLDRSTHEARFFGAFQKALAPGTNRDLKVVTTLAERWGG